jgi:hypothetical protein
MKTKKIWIVLILIVIASIAYCTMNNKKQQVSYSTIKEAEDTFVLDNNEVLKKVPVNNNQVYLMYNKEMDYFFFITVEKQADQFTVEHQSVKFGLGEENNLSGSYPVGDLNLLYNIAKSDSPSLTKLNYSEIAECNYGIYFSYAIGY